MKSTIRIACLVLLAAAPCQATTITLTDTGEGWFNQASLNNGSHVSNNYLVGNCGQNGGSPDCNVGEFRDWFQFNIPVLSGPVTSAVFNIDNDTIRAFQSPDVTVDFTSLANVFGFNDLGTGAFYAGMTYTAADNGGISNLLLDAAALAAIQSGGVFGLGGRVTSPTTFSGAAQDQLVFGFSGQTTTLTITTADIPEPATLTLTALGLAGVMKRYRRRRASR